MYCFLLSFVCACSLLAQATESPQEILRQAVAAQQAGKLEDAIHGYTVFLDMYPNAAQVRSNLGAALIGTGRYQPAIEQYNLALKTKPDNAVRLNLALAYYKSAQYANAEQALQTILTAEPLNFQATMLLADCLLRRGDNKQVVALLTPVREQHSSDLAVAYLLGMGLLRDGQTSQSQIVIDQILRNGDSAEVHLLMGTAKFAAREFAPAVIDFAKALELNPNLPDAWSYYGQALFATGDLAGSRKAFLKALEHDPNDFQANLHVGAMYRLDQDYEHALPYFIKAEAVRPSDTAIQYQIALVDIAQDRLPQAQTSLESILKASPDFVEAHVSLATVYYREKRKLDGDHQRAIVQQLNAEKQAEQPAAKLTEAEKLAR